jgi:activator of 2-hydroxyglutaryl-CoA dehydratase
MLALGCDVGTMFTKTVVMDNGNVKGHNITRNTGALREIVDASIHHAAERAGVTLDDIHVRGGTGMGGQIHRNRSCQRGCHQVHRQGRLLGP